MEHPIKGIPLVLTPQKLFKEINSDSGMVKKRKLSMSSDSSDSNSSADKNLFAEQFQSLTLETQTRPGLDTLNQIKVEEPQPGPTLIIPKTVKLGKVVGGPETLNAGNNLQKKSLLFDINKLTPNDITGIQKYLNFDLGEKFNTLTKMSQSSIPTPSTNTNSDTSPDSVDNTKPKSNSMYANLLKPTMAFPFVSPDYFTKMMTGLDNKMMAPNGGADSYAKKTNYIGNPYIGYVNRDIRRQKVERYLEKKKNRKWKHIRYSIRKDLADKRERHQGRFVKTNKCLSHSDMIQRVKLMEEKKNADLTSSLTNLGKRADKTNLLDDTTIPNNLNMDSIEMKDPNF